MRVFARGDAVRAEEDTPMATAPFDLIYAPEETLIACHQCDLLMRHPELRAGESARCPRCSATVARRCCARPIW